MSGLGAWSYGVYKKGMVLQDHRQTEGLLSLKREMIYIGHGSGITLTPEFGKAMDRNVRELQQMWGHLVNGQIGSHFARYLFWARANREAHEAGVPDRLVHKLMSQESTHDPVAQGYYDPEDEGGAQINLHYHPDVTLEEAWDPAFYVPWLAGWLELAAASLADWDGAVASWNVGGPKAELWVQAGKPPSGLWDEDAGIDWFTRATDYVRRVRAQRVF